MEKTVSITGRNRFKGILYLIGSVVLLIVGMKFYGQESSFFQSFDTIRFSGQLLTYDIANTNRLILENFKELLWKFFKGYIIPFYFLLLPGIFILSAGLGRLTGNEIDILKFLDDDRKEKKFLLIVFTICFVSILLIHFFVLLGYPLASDEFSYIFQSEIIATGRIYADAPPSPESLTGDNIVANNGKWYSKYTIGWPLLLALGQLIHIPFLINALLASGSLLLLYLMAKQIFGKTAGVLAIIITLFSPYFLLQAASFYLHTSSGFFVLLLVYSVMQLMDEKKLLYSIIAGFSICMILLIRPVDAAIICIGIVPWLIFLILKSDKRADTILKMIPIPMGFILGIALLMFVNYAQNNNPFLFSFVQHSSSEKWGFGCFGHTPVKGLWNVTFSCLRMGFWVTPFILTASIMSFLSKKVEPVFLSIIAIGFPAFYFFYYGLGGVEFGARYYFPAFVLLIPLAAGGIEYAAFFLKQRGVKTGQNLVPAFIILTSVFMLSGVFPALLSSAGKVYKANRKYYKWLENPVPSEEKTITVIKNSPEAQTDLLIRNHWNCQNQKNISAIWFLPEENQKLINAFPDRKPYVITFDYGKNDFTIKPYSDEDKADATDYIFAAVNYEACMGNIDKAVEILKETKRLFPDNPSVEYSLGALLFKHERYEEAVEVLTSLVKHRQDNADAFYFLGRSLGNIGKTVEALNTFKLFTKNFPDSPRMQRAREWIQYYSGQNITK